MLRHQFLLIVHSCKKGRTKTNHTVEAKSDSLNPIIIWNLATHYTFLQRKKKILLWFLWGYELYVIWIYSVVSWIAAPLVFVYVILFHNASHRRKQTCFVHTNSQYCNGKTFPRQTKAGESNFGKTRLWMSDFLFLLFFLLHMVSEKEANGKLEVVSPLLCTSNDSSS